VAVVTETLARRYFGAGDPIGRRITVSWSGQPRTALVVGTVGAVRHDGLDQAPRPEVFIPHAQVPYGSMTFVIRSASPDIPGLDALKHCIRVLDPLQTFYRTATLGELVDRTLTGRRFTVRVLGAFALLALLLATIGLYAVISLSIAERRQEFGIRLAIGARPSSLVCDVVLDSLRLSLVGGGLGLFAFMGAASLARRFLFGVSPADPLVIIALLGTVLGVALLASVLAARHLTRVNPVEALQGTS
jgi:hypothetical protein